MSRTDKNSVSIDEALRQARTWGDKKATLLLSISSPPDNVAVCDELAGWLSYVAPDGASLRFDWQKFKSDPDVSTKPLVDGSGHFVLWLDGASFSMADSPKKSITILRGSYRYVLQEVRASAFEQS